MAAVAASTKFKENIEFNILITEADFLESQAACEELDLDPPASLGSFVSREEYDSILEAIREVPEDLVFVWIGLERPEVAELSSEEIAEAYEFIDGTPNFFINTPFIFPWAADEPSAGDANQLCAAISIRSNDDEFERLDDQRCNRRNGILGALCKRYLSDSATQVAADESYQITVVTLPDEANSFEDGITTCEKLNPPGKLASFSNADEFNLILDTIQLVPTLGIAWVGLRRGPDAEGVKASDFEFLNGTSNDFTSIDNQFPWANDEPNNLEGDQECGCISYSFDQPNTLEDLQCDGQDATPVGAVCKQLITNSPTLSPTVSPTLSPTFAPTLHLRLAPTFSPLFVKPTDDIQIISIFCFVSGGILLILVFPLLLMFLKAHKNKKVSEQLDSLRSRRVESLL